MSNISPGQDLDLSFLYEIADGSNEFIIESIDMFLVQTAELLETIATAVGDKDWTLTASASHKLKPNLGFFGMPTSQALVQEIELMAKSGAPDPAILSSKFNEVREIVAVNIISLTKIRADLEAGG